MKFILFLLTTALLFSGCHSHDCDGCDGDKKDPVKPAADANSLFNGKDLTDWKKTEFGGEGEVKVEKGSIHLDYGNPMTGITWAGKDKIPTLNYEIELEAMKVDGNDFFVGLTFPYKDSHLTLILGGWGGFVSGISSFDHFDASENDTSFTVKFAKNKWYKVAVRVKEDHIVAILDGKKVVDTRIDGRKVHTRPEVDLSKPLGICSFETRAAYKNIRLKKLK